MCQPLAVHNRFGTIRSQVLPQQCRSALMVLFRVPLNLLVVGILFNSDRMGHQLTLMCCCGILTAAAVLHGALRMILRAQAERKNK